jgi:phosphate-selective porin OprO/OprP
VQIVVILADMPLALAQDASPADSNRAMRRIAELEEKVRLMSERLALLESKLGETSGGQVATGAVLSEAAAPQIVSAVLNAPVLMSSASLSPASPQVPAASVDAGPEGFFIRSAESDFVLRFRYQLHVDGRFGTHPKELTDHNTFFLRRTQPILEGTLYDRFNYHVLTDFSQGRVRVVNAFVDVNVLPSLGARIGRFKPPIGLERLRSGMTLPLMERALPTQLVPSRDIGVMFSGRLAAERISYEAGLFNGIPDGENSDLDIDDDKEFSGRLMTQPWISSPGSPLSGLTIGVGGSYGNVEGNLDFNGLAGYSSSGDREFFQYRSGADDASTVVADGVRYRVSPQGYYYVGPFGLMAEYVQSAQEVRRGSATAMMNHSSWQLVSSYVLTGDEGSYEGVIPDRPFSPEIGHWGALELAARYTELTADSEAFPLFSDPQDSAGEARAWSLGLNWYLNRNVKLVFGFERTEFESVAPGVVFDTENIFQQRFQLRF